MNPRILAPLLATLIVAPSAIAGGVPNSSITDYNPKTLTVGTVVTITGVFGAAADLKRPKVSGTQVGEKKKVVFKVLTNDDTTITAEVKKIPTSKQAPAAGTAWTLNVEPKGKDAYGASTHGTDFMVVGPTVVAVNPATAGPGDAINVTIDNAGKKPPKLKIGGKKAKLKPAPDPEGTTTSEYTTKVPKSLANGLWDVQVDTPIGSDTQAGGFTMTGSNKKIGKATVTATVNGENFSAKGGKVSVTLQPFIAILALAGKNPFKSMQILVPFDPQTDTPPITYTNVPAILSYVETTLNGGIPSIVTWSGGTFSITINASSGGQIAGTFSGTNLVSTPPGEPNVNIVGGSFISDAE